MTAIVSTADCGNVMYRAIVMYKFGKKSGEVYNFPKFTMCVVTDTNFLSNVTVYIYTCIYIYMYIHGYLLIKKKHLSSSISLALQFLQYIN